MTVAPVPRPAREPFKLDLEKFVEVDLGDLLIRFAFGFAVSVVAAIVVKAMGAAVGGMLLAFPAILPATTTLLERRQGLAQATADVRGATVGAIAMVAFAVIAWQLMGRAGPTAALAAASGGWVVACLVVLAMMRGLVHVIGEHHYLPEIPVSEAAQLVTSLEERGLTVAFAESATGGLAAGFVASVPGASQVLRGGVVAYDDEIKRTMLGVPLSLLERTGAVSAEVAAAMAQGARERFEADVALAVTGLTGAGRDGKPAGLTYLAVVDPDGCVLVRRYDDNFGPGRNDERAIRMLFRLAMDVLEDSTAEAHNVLRVAPGAPL